MALVQMETKLFPPHMDQGSVGIAVLILQCLLIATGYADQEMMPDGYYGEYTASSIRKLQEDLGIQADGNFNQITRSAWAVKGVDVEKIPLTEGTIERTRYRSPDSPDHTCWPRYKN